MQCQELTIQLITKQGHKVRMQNKSLEQDTHLLLLNVSKQMLKVLTSKQEGC